MEFAWNTQKNLITDVKGLEKEQNREGKITNEEIDQFKTHENYDLVESDLNLYQRVKSRVDEVRPISRIQKNSVVDYSNIITVPQEQFDKWGVEKSKKYLEEVYNYFCKEFGKENVVSAKVHLDETTPHMHLHFVPVSEVGKLQARSVMTPVRINKIHDEAPKYLQEKGFDVVRGKGKTDKSLEIKEFKIDKLKEERQVLEAEINAIEGKLEHLKGNVNTLENINAIKTVPIPFSSKLSISANEYKDLVDVAQNGIRDKAELTYQQRLTNSLYKQIDDLKSDIEGLKIDNNTFKKDCKELRSKGRLMQTVLRENNLMGEVLNRYNNPKEKKAPEHQAQVSKHKIKTYEMGD